MKPKMAEPTLEQVFGNGATQDANTLVIQKEALEPFGLVSSASNRGESIFVAMIKLSAIELNDAKREQNSDIQIVFNEPSESLITQNNVRYRVTSYTIELYKPEGDIAVNPMDY